MNVDHHVDRGEACCRSCCGGGVDACASLFCLKPQQSLMSRLGVTWFWTLLLPLVLGLVLGFVIFAPFHFRSSPGDQRDVMRDYDSFFCDGVNVSSDVEFNAYLMAHKPEILQNNYSVNTFTLTNLTVEPGSYDVWDFYLLKGSSIFFELCNLIEMEFFMLEGEDNFKKWKGKPSGCDCYIDHISYHGNLSCWNQTKNGSGDDHFLYNFTASVDRTQTYYLVFQNPSIERRNQINLNLEILRTVFNLVDGLKQTCEAQTSCGFSLALFSSDSVVYESITGTQFDVDNKVTCNPTWGVYFFLFGGIPMVAGFCVSLFLFVVYMQCPRAWEGVERPKPWDEGKINTNQKSIFDAVSSTDDEKKSNGKAKSKKTTSKAKRLGYDSLSEDESDEESLQNMAGAQDSPPPPYSSIQGAAPEADADSSGSHVVVQAEVHDPSPQ